MTAGDVEIELQEQAVWIGKPTADTDELDDEVRRAISRAWKHHGLLPRPEGSNTVEKTSASLQRFIRDPDVVAWVQLRADGKCEACEKPAPFKRDVGSGFLEVHHVKTLASGGPDTVDNAIACCPNCHRELHYGKNRGTMKRDLFSRVHRLFKH
ncbi:HNH endonuclease signature motif containing protein [uncultured Sulfitobacter sp.]|uniref:HNH endonuclease n=1 Tax=uncultured Sulfitobacter sp. TaxID=191468 RepID=UPI00344F1AEC